MKKFNKVSVVVLMLAFVFVLAKIITVLAATTPSLGTAQLMAF